MNPFNPVCECGHDLAAHEKIYNGYGGDAVTFCRGDDGDVTSEFGCPCSGFRRVDSGHEQTVGEAEGGADGDAPAEGAPAAGGAEDRVRPEAAQAALREDLTPPERDFGTRVREARRSKGWTLERTVRELTAVGCDLGDRPLSAIERGDREPRLSEAYALRDVLDVDIEPVDEDRFYVTLSVAEPGGAMYTSSMLVGDGDVGRAISAVHKAAWNRYTWR